MSYMRGHIYCWSDDERLHIWSANGYDGWDDSGWAEGMTERDEEGRRRASGVAIPLDTFDELVVMRLAQMIHERRIGGAIRKACEKFGANGGCAPLARNAQKLTAALSDLVLDEA